MQGGSGQREASDTCVHQLGEGRPQSGELGLGSRSRSLREWVLKGEAEDKQR